MDSHKLATSGLNVEKRKFTWKIENFDIIRRSNEYVNSQKLTFKAGEIIGLPSGWEFFLQQSSLKAEGEQVEKRWIGCYLKLQQRPRPSIHDTLMTVPFIHDTFLTFPCKTVNASWEVKVLGNQNNCYCHRKSSFKNFIENDAVKGWGWNTIIPQDAELKDLPLINGCLVMELEMELFAPKPMTLIGDFKDLETIERIYKPKFSDKLQEDLGKVFRNLSQNEDATAKVVTKDGKEFVVTRGIVSARSPVFQKMFESDMKEANTGIVRISDISSKTMSVLLRFIYTGTLHKNWRDADVISELMYSADKYQLSDLLEFLDQVVGIVCTKESAATLLNLANKLSMKTAEKKLLEFMKENMKTFDDVVSLFAFHNEPEEEENDEPTLVNNEPLTE